jgi:uncharacterized protein (TIGR03084 family)
VSVDLAELLAHLDQETVPLMALLVGLDAEAWEAPTPAEGWTVRDQVSHLAYFDEAATVALADPAAFARQLDEAVAFGGSFPDEVAERYRATPPPELLAWWGAARTALGAAARAADPSTRAPWYGPPLSVASMLSGRIMETWAHGQDVYDAVGWTHPVTDALYDVARLGARTRANSYAARGLSVPDGEVSVELRAPDGTSWQFGSPGDDAVIGDAVEFCLVTTQRRHLDDTALVATGPRAREWLSIAQAFAGPPGSGRGRAESTW